MKSEVQVIVGNDGSIRFIYDDDLLGLAACGKMKVSRASHVEPNSDGKWEADMSPVGGPVLGPYKTRNEALEEEVKWLTNANIPFQENYI
jgi:hypothetical protein